MISAAKIDSRDSEDHLFITFVERKGADSIGI